MNSGERPRPAQGVATRILLGQWPLCSRLSRLQKQHWRRGWDGLFWALFIPEHAGASRARAFGQEGFTGIRWNSFDSYCAAVSLVLESRCRGEVHFLSLTKECNFHAFSTKEICGSMAEKDYELIYRHEIKGEC